MAIYRASSATLRLARAARKHFGSYEAMFAAARKGEDGIHYIDLPEDVRQKLKTSTRNFGRWLAETILWMTVTGVFIVIGFNWWQVLLSVIAVALCVRFLKGFARAETRQ